jgi:hypothetical protein
MLEYATRVFCSCKGNPDCPICFGNIYLNQRSILPDQSYYQGLEKGLISKPKPTLTMEERFLMMDDFILPDIITIIILERKQDQSAVEIYRTQINCKTKYKEIGYSIGLIYSTILSKLSLCIAYKLIKNKYFLIETLINDKTTIVDNKFLPVSMISKNTITSIEQNLALLESLVKYFKKEFMPENL